MASAPAPTLSDAELSELLGLLAGADTVELKLTVPEIRRPRPPVTALGMDPLDAQIRQVFFFDTPDLALNARASWSVPGGVQRKGDDSVVKLRPVDPERASRALREVQEFGVEVDAMPGGFVCSAR